MSHWPSTKFDLARITLELLTPARMSGQETLSPWDAAFVADPDGLPTIPGTSLAGILRHAYARHKGEDPDRGPHTRKLFGYQERTAGEASRVAVSFAQVHDQHDRPAPFRIAIAEASPPDPVLSFLKQGVVRDHVRLDHRGVESGRGKYDELLIPAGARFTFELQVFHDGDGGEDHHDLEILVGLLAHPLCRLGASGRRGLGRFRIVRALHGRFDLGSPSDRERFARLPVDLSALLPAGLLEILPVPRQPITGWAGARLRLEPREYWLFGGGRAHRPEHRFQAQKVDRQTRELTAEDKLVDRVPFTERRIRWDEAGRGKVTAENAPDHVIPGSAVKGALRHRVVFHYLRRRGIFAGDTRVAEAERQVEALFGGARDDDSGTAGRVYVDDAVVPRPRYGGPLQHVSLDRFTMGPMDGLLFAESPLWKGPALEIEVGVDFGGDDVPPELVAALDDALGDLVGGRLAVGAHGSRGYGTFSGAMDWDDQGKAELARCLASLPAGTAGGQWSRGTEGGA